MKSTPDLRSLCLAGGSHPVAIRAGVALTADDLCRLARAMASGLHQRPERTWALWLESPFEFLCSFMALALAGKRIVLPGNMQTGTAAALAPHFDALIARDAVTGLERAHFTPEALSADTADFHIPATPSTHIELLLFTSGSTGEPKAVAKTLALLEAELAVLNQQWGEAFGRLPVLATVSHQHIYGLLHLLLWPLVRRAAFFDEVCQYPEELMARARSQTAVVLVSSPTHLKRLPLAEDFIGHHQHIRHIVSSAGLLATEAAMALAQLMGAAPWEILGSTETGGVAWRQQHQSSAWQALPGVSCRLDEESECLAVQSQHISAGEGQHWLVMGDRVQFHGREGFSLCGRADQIVKVEGKRMSVTDMEARLQAHPLVDQARVAVVRHKREEVGVVAVLSEEGRNRLARDGKLALNQLLRDYLLAFFERPLLPRRWRYVSDLPVNAQGKVTLAEVQALLEDKGAGNQCVEDKLMEDKLMEDKWVEDRCLEDRCIEDKRVENKRLQKKPLQKGALEKEPLPASSSSTSPLLPKPSSSGPVPDRGR